MSQMNFKSLTDLALNVSEDIYREHPALSYSTIAKYEKYGFSSVYKLKEPVEGEAILFGSMVDTLITEGRERFDEKFVVANYQIPTDSVKEVIDTLIRDYNIVDRFEQYADTTILRACIDCNFQSNFKDETRVKKIKELGAEYFNGLKLIGDKKIVSQTLYNEALTVVQTLYSAPQSTCYLQHSNNNTEFLYQTKFLDTINGFDFKCMFDLLIVSHQAKIILPIDLKTTSLPEYEFPKKYLENRYDIQSRLYTRILEDVISRDDYFKDFKILNFNFLVINKISLTPLIFEDEKCKAEGDIEIIDKYNKRIMLRDPVTIGKELQGYLGENATVPNYINVLGKNKIHELLNYE